MSLDGDEEAVLKTGHPKREAIPSSHLKDKNNAVLEKHTKDGWVTGQKRKSPAAEVIDLDTITPGKRSKASSAPQKSTSGTAKKATSAGKQTSELLFLAWRIDDHD